MDQVEVSVKDSPEVAAMLDESARKLAEAKKDNDLLDEAMREQVAEVDRLRGVVHEQLQQLREISGGSDIKHGFSTLSAQPQTKAEVVHDLVRNIAGEAFMLRTRSGLTASAVLGEDVFMFAEELYDIGVKRGIYQPE